MGGRGRGRGRGRAEAQGGPGQGQGQQAGAAGPAPAAQAWPAPAQQGQGQGRGGRGRPLPQGAPPPQHGAAAPQPQGGGSAWGAQRGPAAPPVTSTSQTTQQMQQLSLGTGPRTSSGRDAGPSESSGRGAKEGEGSVGRGAMRGRRIIEQRLHTKPKNCAKKQGDGGTPIGLIANYFKVNTIPNWALQQYRVDIAPEEDRTFERKQLLKPHNERIGGWYIFDGTVLYTDNRLTTRLGESFTLTSQNETGTIFSITVKHVGELQFGDYAYTQVFNMLVRSSVSFLGLQLVGRDFYDPDPKVKIQLPRFRMELWPGYKTSIRQHETQILMNVEITHKVMRMDTVLDHLSELYRQSGNNYRRQAITDVVGCVVLTKYNNKTYRIDDIDFDINPNHTFRYKDRDISYADYMKEKYQIQIRDRGQPMLVSRAKARDVRAGMAEIIYLIPELCHSTGINEQMRGNFNLMRALADHTRVNPATRIAKLQSFNQRLQSNPKVMEQLKRFDMTLDKDLVRVPGRLLESETMYFGAKKSVALGNSVDWTGDLRRCPLLLPKEISNWFIVVPPPFARQTSMKADTLAFVQLLQRAGASMGVRIANPQIYDLQRDSVGDYVQALGQILDQGQPQLIMCVVTNIRGDRYAAIKKKCCVDRAVPTQVVQSKNLNDAKKSLSIATKVVIQMNCKIGGAPWRLDVPLKSLMVVGFDVCHDTASKSQSFGAMVASLDPSYSRYFSAVTPHTSGEELSNNLGLNIIKALRKYREVNQTLPDKIIVYRDGVGEGQIPYVYSTELESIKEKLQGFYAGSPVSLAFIVVTKRINTRIFTDPPGNPPPGTAVDSVITDPEKFDFFLVSQSVRDGTVAPTSYNVLLNDIAGLVPHRLQRLTYKMCHLYFNWSGTVRVPAPCQYAHKLAFLVGQSLHREPSSRLEDLLYFL